MIILTETTDKIEITLGTGVISNQFQCFVSYRDLTSSSFLAARYVTNTNDTTDVTLVPSPTGVQRVIDFINIHNKDSAMNRAIIKADFNGIEYILYDNYIDPQQTLTYTDGNGWSAAGGYRSIKSFTVHGDAGANFAMTNAAQAERFAGNSSRHIFVVDLEGYTEVRFRVNKMVISASTNAPFPYFAPKYYTTYSTTVANFLPLTTSSGGSGLHCDMRSLGYFDSNWLPLSSGARINGCCIGFVEGAGDGVADPAVGAVDILFR